MLLWCYYGAIMVLNSNYNFEVHFANAVIKLHMNCGIFAVVMGIILRIMGYLFEQCSKA